MGEKSPVFIKMNKYTPNQTKNIIKNRALFKVGSKFNSYDVNLNEDEKHDKKIRDLFFEMRRLGMYLAVRQPLINGNVPDIAVLSSEKLIVKEVMLSESDKRFQEKDYLGATKIKVRI
ncbi:hypothetical protein LCGC14_0570010 [marine sediment metagenome]|uniref:Uncharacterized protein n=1 Tax=marine sediment metagenome TaxID=412755 RepID=A0A0F9RPL9_9ZZZZ